jgi:predicted O-methyltransferase YrrM
MLAPEFAVVHRLLQAYLGKRPRRGPFPLESALTWSVLLCAQSSNARRGDLLEIGVEFGTSAFLLMESMRPDEHLTLIDLAVTAEWREGIEGPYRDRNNHSFIVGSSLELAPSQLPDKCRWIHIDGGHLYHHVESDLELTANSLQSDGILVLDDFFEIRWPDVTAAVMDYLRENRHIVPFMLVNRKLYCTADQEAASAYRTMLQAFFNSHTKDIGQVRWWNDVAMLDREILVAKMIPGADLVALETDRG